jgi:hypothetical protein
MGVRAGGGPRARGHGGDRAQRLVLLDHVASDRWWVLTLQKLLEQVTRRTNGDYQTRRPLPLVIAAGFVVDHSERAKFGWVERLVATKPKV